MPWLRAAAPAAFWLMLPVYALVVASQTGGAFEPLYGWNGDHYVVPILQGRLHAVLCSGLVGAAVVFLALTRSALRARGAEERLRSLVLLQCVVFGWIAIDIRFQRHEQLPGWWGPSALLLTAVLQLWLVVQMRAVLRRIPATWVPVAFTTVATALLLVDAIEGLAGSSIHAGLEHLAEIAFALGLASFAWALLRREIDRLPPGADRLTFGQGWLDCSGAFERWRAPVGIRLMWVSIAAVVGAGAFVALVPALTGHNTLLGLIPTFDLDAEWNVPAFFSTMLLVAAASIAFAHASSARAVRNPWRRHWLLLALGLAAMAIDEASSLHEMLGDPLKEALALHGTIFEFSWVVAAIPAVVIGAVFFWPMVKALPAGDRLALLLAGFVYFGGAVGVEIPEGWVAAHVGQKSLAYELLVVLEETMEIVGIGLVVSRLFRMLPFGRNPGMPVLAPLSHARRRSIPRCASPSARA